MQNIASSTPQPASSIPADSSAQRPLPQPTSQYMQHPPQSSAQAYPRPDLQGAAGSRNIQPVGQSQGQQLYHNPAMMNPRQRLPPGSQGEQPNFGMPVARPAGFSRGVPASALGSIQGSLHRPLQNTNQRPAAPPTTLMSNSLQSYGVVYPNSRPGVPASAVLPQSLPPMANKAMAGPANRPAQAYAARGNPTAPLRTPMPQMSQQAYLQQASAQLQNFQGGQLYTYQPIGPDGQPMSRTIQAPVSHPYRTSHPAMVSGPRPASASAPSPGAMMPLNLAKLPPGSSSTALLPPNIHLRPRSTLPMRPVSNPQVKRPISAQSEWAGPQLVSIAITVADRKVRVDNKDEGSTPMYVLLRRWIHNDPNIYLPKRERLLIPRRPLPKTVPDDTPPPKVPCDPTRSSYRPEELLYLNKQHWLRVRRHHISRRHRRLNQFRQRLATLIPNPAMEAHLAGGGNSQMQSIEASPDDSATPMMDLRRAVHQQEGADIMATRNQDGNHVNASQPIDDGMLSGEAMQQ